MAFNRLLLIKVIELALAIVILGLEFKTTEANETSHLVVITGTIVGYVIVTLGTTLGLLTNSPVPKTVDIFFCLLGAILYIAAGSLAIQHFQGWTFRSEISRLGLTKGSLAIIQGVILLFDSFFTYRS